MMITYAIIAIIIFPFLLVFYVPCAAAFKGGKSVNNCLVSYHQKDLTKQKIIVTTEDSKEEEIEQFSLDD